MIKRFIVWYLKRHNVMFYYKGYVVRMFSEAYYDKVMANNLNWEALKSARPREKEGAE
ncbi:MAG: hypothetical protein IJZ81_04975 [Clostridia bacterium]|nr:hypothetical protein [Clostridia bacterium]